jgi:hypothetical protein
MSARQRFEAVESLELVQAGGDVAIKGWDEAAIELSVDEDEAECTVEQSEGVLRIECRAPLAVHVPRSAVVNVGQVSGDLLVRGLDRVVSVGEVHGDASLGAGEAAISIDEVGGDLGVEHLRGPFSASQVHGDVYMSHVGDVRIGRAHSDLSVRGANGEFQLGVVDGDVRLRNVSGPVTLEEGRSDFRAKELAGGLTVHQVGGDLSLKTEITPGLTYSARASGDISAQLPSDTSAHFTLQAQGQVSAKLPQIEEQTPDRVVGQAGEGEAQVILEAGGDLRVKVRGADKESEWDFSMDSLGAEIEAQIRADLGEMEYGEIAAREIEKAMRQVDREVVKAQRRAEKAAQQAEEHARQAEERALRAQERAMRKAQRFQAKFEREWGTRGPQGPSHHRRASRRAKPSRQGPSSDEQLAILRMLQEGTISVEDAEGLLKALGG